MRVAIVQKDLKNLRSGVSRLVRAELDALTKAQHEPILISERVNPVTYQNTSAHVYKTLRWPFKGYFRRRFFLWQSERLLRKLEPDVSIAHGDISNVDICFIHNCVHLEHEIIHGSELPIDNDVGQLHTEVLTQQRFLVLVCNSEIMKRDLVSRFSIQDKQIEVLYPCCDPEAVIHPTLDQRKGLGISPDDLVLGLITSGNFKKRNVGLFLEATAQLRSPKPLHIVVAGNGKESDFQDLLAGHPHKVHFLPSTDQVANYYAMLDVFALPAHIEEFGMSALEAMTCEKPVVLHHMVGASEIVEGESRRFVLQTLQRNMWVDALQELCDDPGLRIRVARQNAETARKYTAREQDKQFMRILNDVFSGDSVATNSTS